MTGSYAFRRHPWAVFQSAFNLIPEADGEENVALPLLLDGSAELTVGRRCTRDEGASGA